jgi:hypothetical protein
MWVLQEASQKIMELEALCRRLREDTQKLKEEKTKLEGMVESRDELIMEIAKETGLNYMGEDAEDEPEDDDDRGDTTAPDAVVPSPFPTPPAAAHEVIVINNEDLMEMVPELDDPVAHELILVDAAPELPQPRLYCTLIWDHEERTSTMMDDPHELDDPTDANYDVDEGYAEDGSNDRDFKS